MVDFLKLLPRERREPIRRRVAAEAREASRLHALPDRWLANEVLKLARTVRAAIPAGRDDGYNALLLWDVMPEIARRLGGRIDANEVLDHEVRTCPPERLREIAAQCHQNLGRSYLKDAERTDADLCPVSFLTREAANGNPVAIALDRAAPPGPDAKDSLARHLSRISARRGHPATQAWHPALQGDPAPARQAEDEPSRPGMAPAC